LCFCISHADPIHPCYVFRRDLQSYFADLSLFLANDSKKMYILVDNRPWVLSDPRSRVWQLMVNKIYLQSRSSPFVYSKARRERKEVNEVCSQSNTSKPKKIMRWFSRKRVLLPVKTLRNSLQFSSELHRTLYGFIVFEVAWNSVRGINYYNELQVLDLFDLLLVIFSFYYLYRHLLSYSICCVD